MRELDPNMTGCHCSEEGEVVCDKQNIISQNLPSLPCSSLSTILVAFLPSKMAMRNRAAVKVFHICPKASRPTYGGWCKFIKYHDNKYAKKICYFSIFF